MRGNTSSGIERVVKIVLPDEAQRRFEAEERWWREHRDAKELFLDEFSDTLEQLSAAPCIGQNYRRARAKLIQRLLMKKTRCHVNYWHDHTAVSSRFIRSGERAENADPPCKNASTAYRRWQESHLHVKQIHVAFCFEGRQQEGPQSIEKAAFDRVQRHGRGCVFTPHHSLDL
jgi:hypothetical protein